MDGRSSHVGRAVITRPTIAVLSTTPLSSTFDTTVFRRPTSDLLMTDDRPLDVCSSVVWMQVGGLSKTEDEASVFDTGACRAWNTALPASTARSIEPSTPASRSHHAILPSCEVRRFEERTSTFCSGKVVLLHAEGRSSRRRRPVCRAWKIARHAWVTNPADAPASCDAWQPRPSIIASAPPIGRRNRGGQGGPGR